MNSLLYNIGWFLIQNTWKTQIDPIVQFNTSFVSFIESFPSSKPAKNVCSLGQGQSTWAKVILFIICCSTTNEYEHAWFRAPNENLRNNLDFSVNFFDFAEKSYYPFQTGMDFVNNVTQLTSVLEVITVHCESFLVFKEKYSELVGPCMCFTFSQTNIWNTTSTQQPTLKEVQSKEKR